MMLLLKKIFLSFLFLLLLLTRVPFTQAASGDDFSVSATAVYTVTNSNAVRVKQNISLVNKKEFVYAPSYSITLRLKNISDVSATNAKGAIPFTLKEEAHDTKIIQVEFSEKVVGIGETNSFSLAFNTSDYINKSGNIHTITIPSTSNIADFDEYFVQVITPNNFGSPSVVKPSINFDSSENTYTFTKDNLQDGGISMAFGEKQYYFFKLSYNLENKNLFPVKTEIALPSNTSYQNVLINSISPQPESVYKDKDGNYMASYTIPSKTGFSVKAHVLVESFLKPVLEALDLSARKYYIRPQKYWESDKDIIKKAASGLHTPEEIYKYVIKTLSYNNTKTADKNDRLGASLVLSKPYFAVCLEFTDLFIALARSKGIPARAVEGYAVTLDDPTRPASLFEDVLHAWPEYYDDNKKTWIMIDPTWGDTTKGVDYFNTFDFDHVSFVRNGLSSSYPIPAGGYKAGSNTKDIVMSFADPSEFIKREKLTLKSSFSPFLEQNKIRGTLTVQNKGNAQDAPQNTHMYVDGEKVMSIQFPSAPPLGESSLTIDIPIPNYSFINSLTNVSHTVTIQGENGKVLSRANIKVFPFSLPILIGGAALIGSLIIFSIAFKTRSLPFQK